MFPITSAVDDVLSLFFPRLCLGCGCAISKFEKFICINCTSRLSFAEFTSLTDNDLSYLMTGRCDIKYTTTLFYSNKHSLTRKLLYELKYKGKVFLGDLFGVWLGREISNSSMKDVDIVIPVPLDKNRKRKRGYNQSEKFAKKLAFYLKAIYCGDHLIKLKSRASQVGKSKWERWSISEKIFHIKDKTFFQGKHILIVDDLITTGNTIQNCISCFEDISKITISIATIAMTRNS